MFSLKMLNKFNLNSLLFLYIYNCKICLFIGFHLKIILRFKVKYNKKNLANKIYNIFKTRIIQKYI